MRLENMAWAFHCLSAKVSLLDTFYCLELIRWSCNFKEIRKCRRASIYLVRIFSLLLDPWAKIPSGVGQGRCYWSADQKFVEIDTWKSMQKRGEGRQEESLVWQEGVPWSPQLAEFSFWPLGRPGTGADMQYWKVTLKDNCSTLLWKGFNKWLLNVLRIHVPLKTMCILV